MKNHVKMNNKKAKPNGVAIKELKNVDKEIASNGEALMNVGKEEASIASNGEHFKKHEIHSETFGGALKNTTEVAKGETLMKTTPFKWMSIRLKLITMVMFSRILPMLRWHAAEQNG